MIARLKQVTVDKIGKERLRQLEAGAVQSRTHAEEMALDMCALLASSFPHVAFEEAEVRELPFLGRMRLIGQILWDAEGLKLLAQDEVVWISDTVRGWIALGIGSAPGYTLEERVRLLESFATDQHFAVREWAWLAIRDEVAADVGEAVQILLPCVRSDEAFLRRFAVEVTRPRSVWGTHIRQLKDDPSMGEPLIAPLRCEPDRYVQDSIANWLNDAGKLRPEWVARLVGGWLRECACASTRRIAVRATRSIEPDGRLSLGS